MEKIRQMVDVNTVLGDPVTTPDGTTVIPVTRVSYGFASGGSDLPSKSQPAEGLFAGGSGAGITLIPIAFLAISHGNVRLLQIEPFTGPIDRALEKIPELVDKVSMLLKKDKKHPEAEDSIETPKSAEEPPKASCEETTKEEPPKTPSEQQAE